VASPSLEMLKTQLDTALANLLWLPQLDAGLDYSWPLEVPANLRCSLIHFSVFFLMKTKMYVQGWSKGSFCCVDFIF